MADQAYYMLRKTLPPWKAEDTIHELLDFALHNSVDEIMWKIDTEEFSHGLPSLDMIKEYLPWLNRARELLNKNDVKSSINPWVTMCHGDRGRQAHPLHADMRMFVTPSGIVHTCRPCPLDDVWQNWLIEAYKLYASAKPEILWLEDDLTFNSKDCRGQSPDGYGCFCDAHIEVLSRLSGTEWKRERLVEALKKPGSPAPVRRQWFEMLGRSMVELGEKLEKEVHAIDQSTRLGHMFSWSNDARWWDEFGRAIAGPHQPVARPSLSLYSEEYPIVHLFDARDHRKECRCAPENTRLCPELENLPYGAFAKSTRFTRMEMALSQIMGYPDITINLFDHLGTPVRDEKRYFSFLREIKPFLSGIASRAAPRGQEKGVGIIFRPNAADYIHLDSEDASMRLPAHAGGEAWAAGLQAAGIPVVWNDREVDIVCATGQVLRACSDDEIREFLSRGLLIDSAALEILIERGFSDYVGCTVAKWHRRYDKLITAEEVARNVSRAPTYMSLETPEFPSIAELDPNATAEVASYLINNDRERILPGMVLFENSIGGRVAVYALKLAQPLARRFSNWNRKEQIFDIIRWLGRGKVDLFVEGGAWMVPIRRDAGDHIFVGIVNLETDSWDEICLTLSSDRTLKTVDRVQTDGSWKKCDASFDKSDDSTVRIAMKEKLEYMDAAAFIIH